MNSITSAGVTANDVEITLRIELLTLSRRQPLAEKTARTHFWPILPSEAPIERAHSAQGPAVVAVAASERKHRFASVR